MYLEQQMVRGGEYRKKEIGERSSYFCRKAERPLRAGQECSLQSGLRAVAFVACIRHYCPRLGGNLNCAGAHHGNLTPPGNARSCVQEYHCRLTGSWRGQLAKAVLA